MSILRYAFLSAVLAAMPLPAQQVDTTWMWSDLCAKPARIAMRLSLDRRTIHRASLPVCRVGRRVEPGRLTVRFTPLRPLIWYGYRSDEGTSARDPGDTTAARTPFEFDLWYAGGEIDGIDVGFSASAPDGLHMNTIHLLSLTKRSVTILAEGLVLETWPERASDRRTSPKR